MEKAKLKSNLITDIVRATFIALLISLVATLALAIIVKLTSIDEKLIQQINQAIKIISILLGAILGIKCKERGLLKGLIIGTMYTILSLVIFAVTNGGIAFDLSILVDLIAGALAGAVSGMIAVNLPTSKKCNKKCNKKCKC